MNFLITGATRGIGLELAQFALEDGHKVYGVVRNPNFAMSFLTLRKKYPEQLVVLVADVTKMDDLEAVWAQIQDVTIDVMINNAGIFLENDEHFSSLKFDDLHMTFLVNAMAPVMWTQKFLPNLKRSSNPKLANISSKMGSITETSSGGYYAYRMSKSALNMFSKDFSVDCPEVVTLALHPGWVQTDMGGPRATVLPRESARGLYKIIKESTAADSGKFFDYQGKQILW
jgi:NAD(P)-dependent dehydrogenase (short-subunit alcohol dehydrogenase family)